MYLDQETTNVLLAVDRATDVSVTIEMTFTSSFYYIIILQINVLDKSHPLDE